MNTVNYELLCQQTEHFKQMSRRNIVCLAYHNESPFVIKKSNDQEYIFLEKLKDIIKVPKLYYHNKDTFCCEYIDGIELYDWLNSDDYTLHKFRIILFNIINSLIKIRKKYKLFKHGDLYSRNVILLDTNPVFIDFEMSSFKDETSHELYDLYRLFYSCIEYSKNKEEIVVNFMYDIFTPDKYFKPSKYTHREGFLSTDIKHENLPTLKEVLGHPFFLDCNKYGESCEPRSHCQQCQDRRSEERSRRTSKEIVTG